MKKREIKRTLSLKNNIVDLFACFFVILFIVAGTLISLNRFWQYEVSYVDFGQYDQAIWKVSRFQEPILHHFIHGKINVLGDHVTPSVFLISPLYWLTDRSEMILIVQAFAVGLSGLVLYDIARVILRNKLLALSILTCYFFFAGLQNAVITEFHELTVMTLPLMLTFWAIVKNKKFLFFVFLIITLGFKEVTFLLGIGIGIALFLLKKEWRKTGIITILISLLWGFIAFKIIIPYFSHGKYLYAADIPSGFFDKFFAFVDQPQKRRTLLFSFSSFSFLPIFAPQFWFAIIQDYGARFLPHNFVTRWDLGMHYNAQSAVILALSSIFGLNYLLRFSIIKKYASLIAIVIGLNAFILFRFVLHGPFLLAVNPIFYSHSNDFTFLNDIVKKIPLDASVMAQNNLAPRFSHQQVWLLRSTYTKYKPDYILVDNRKDQSPNNFFGTENNNPTYVLNLLNKDRNYKIIYKTKEQFLYKRVK